MDLPLRLYAEPLAREKLGGACFVLPSKHEEDACLLVNDCGLIAVALSGKCDFERASIAKILEIDDDCVPSLILCRGKGWLGEAQSWTPVGGQCQACRCNAAHNCKVPRRVVVGRLRPTVQRRPEEHLGRVEERVGVEREARQLVD